MPISNDLSFLYAVAYQGQSEVKHFLSKGASIDTQDSKCGMTGLHLAVMNNDLWMAHLLLRNKANPNILSNDDMAPLHLAVKNRFKWMVELLLMFGADVDIKAKYGKTPLNVAVDYEYDDMVEVLLQHEPCFEESSIFSRKIIYIAIEKSSEQVACLVAKSWKNIQEIERDFLTGMKPLHLAVRRGYYKLTETLLSMGVNVSEFTAGVVDPLQIAVMENNLPMVQLLVQNGARSQLTSDGLSLHYAISRGYVDMVKLLLDTGAAEINDANEDGLKPIHEAVLCSRLDMVQLLLSYGADPKTCCNNENLPPFYYAVWKGDRRVVRFLIDLGCMDDDRLVEAYDLVDHAVINGFHKIAKELLAKGAMINPVWEYKSEAQEKIGKILIELEADEVSRLSETAQKNLKIVREHDAWRAIYESCMQEVGLMKETKIFNDVTIYDLFSKSAHKMASKLHNDEFIMNFGDSDYKVKFPVFSHVLARRYSDAHIRHALVVTARSMFEKMDLPSLCGDMIIKGLNNEELKNFIRGVCKCKEEHKCLPPLMVIL